MPKPTHYLLNISLLAMFHPVISGSDYVYPNITVTSFCPAPMTLHFPTPFALTPIQPVILSSSPPYNATYFDYLTLEPSDGTVSIQISASVVSEPSTDRLEVVYSLAWGMFYYYVKKLGSGFQDGKIWLGTTDPGCPSVVVDEKGEQVWMGKTGGGGADCKTRPVSLLLEICV